ncbi:TcpE family conjugal transfer membrane protein [Nonomuraea sp. NPDC049714]|uniref:TcpE family conjugal transfer membrane protein n=1 Tax=Nonomuraea sp. NPDC049714 TaxID=3364357 RepID=UPI00379C2860
MDLPTYTNIWRIEKRLYKLYDLRLPMPLPIVWIGVFVGVFVPWSLLLWLVGVPVEMPWHVLYLVPPGIVTWLSTRPVIEGKRLTELLESQLRYLGQPRAWYRLAPGAEPETISFSGRVWRASPARVRVKSTRKARQAQRKRSAQRIAGPRQVRPAVAAAAVAAAQAPLAESPSPSAGWGSRTRPGAAPALGTTALALPPSRQDHEPVRDPRAETRDSAETPAAPRTTTTPKTGQDTPARARTPRDPQKSTARDPQSTARDPQSAARDPQGAARGSQGAVRGSRDVGRDSQGGVRDGRDTSAALRLVRDAPEGASTGRGYGEAGRDDVRTAGTVGTAGTGSAARTARGDASNGLHDGPRTGRDARGDARAELDAVEGAVQDDLDDARHEAAAGGVAERAGERASGQAAGSEAGGRSSRQGESGERAGGRTSRQAAAGKPMDTEALRRLRKLAASADAPSEASALPGGEDERTADEHGRDDEVARNQHRKGQPPRLGPALLLPDAQRGWSPLTPDSTPVKLSRPLRGKGPDSELPALPVHHDDAVPSVSVRPERVDPAQHDDPTRPEQADEELQAPTGSARRDDEGPTPERDVSERPQGVEEGPVGTPEGEEAPSTSSTAPEVPSEALRPLESLPPTPHHSSARPEQPESAEHEPSEPIEAQRSEGAAHGQSESVEAQRSESAESESSERVGAERSAEERRQSPARRPSPQRLRSVEPLEPVQDREPEEDGRSAERQQRVRQEQEQEQEQERSVVGLEAREGGASGAAMEQERLRFVGRPQAPERRDVAAGPPVPVPRTEEREPRVRRVESVVGRDSGGWRRIAQVVVGGNGVRTDGSEIDEARARGVFGGSRRIVVLGCTGGAGQSTTALMLGHTLARYRDDRVVAVDAATGGGSLTSRIEQETPETLTSLLAGLHGVSGYLTMRGFTTRTASGLEVVGADSDAEAEQRLADRNLFSDHRLGEALSLLDRHYKLTVIDPAASLAARVLPYADQLVLVLPASEEAPEAVAMTYEWLDGHGCADLRRRAVMVVNGVSRRSMADVEQAEAVASGRCRAIVRVPWEDGLAPGGDEVVDPGQLRAAGRRAYLALAGVVVAGFAAQRIRPSEEELASDPPGTRIGER